MADYAPVDLHAADQVEFELNGRKVTAPAGTMLVDAAFAHGVEVPIFCYEPRLGPAIGACRQCLVEVEGMRGLQTACSTPVQPDMVVRTDSAAAKDAQDGVLELLLANHPLDCPVCDKGGECPLQDRTFRFGPGRSRFIEAKRHFPKPLDLSSLIALDRERCIHCFRCVRFSQDVAEDRALIMEDRGAGQEIATFTGDTYVGRFTGNITDLCPVGALTSIPYRFVARPWDIANSPTVCSHCPVGCNTELTSREGGIRRITGRATPNFEVEEGWLCDKGRWAHDGNTSPDRIVRPLIHDGTTPRDVPLEESVEAAALVLARSGPVGVLVGPSATVEQGFLAQELVAGPLAGGRIARLGIPESPALAALRAHPGAQLGDLDGAQLVVIVGGDPSNQQPVSELRVRKARRGGSAVRTVGPRAHALHGLGEDLVTAPDRLLDGVRALAEEIAGAEKAVVLWDEADLAAEPDAAAELAAVLGRAPGALQLELGADVNGAGLRALGMPAEGLLEAIAAGEITTLLTIHADPLSAPGANEWERALERLTAVVAIESHASPTVDRANVVVPAQTLYEEEGVLISMNGRAQRVRPGARGPDHAAAAWEILLAIAHRLGAAPRQRTAAQVFAAAAAARPQLAGLDYDALGALGRPIAAAPAPSPNGGGEARTPAGEGMPLVAGGRIFGDVASHRSDALAEVRGGPELTLSPPEAERLGLLAGDLARVASPHGACTLPVRIDATAQDGVAFATLGAPGAPVERLLAPDRGPVRVTVEAAA